MTDIQTELAWKPYFVLADHYDAVRPGYPEAALHAVASRMPRHPGAPAMAADIGSGTGIFTRLLAAALPGVSVVGVEPNDKMVARAEAVTPESLNVCYACSPAESLPFATASVGLATAAGSAQLFDRDVFFREAARVLQPGGALALVQNKRHCSEGGFFSGFEDLLEDWVPGYATGTFADRTGAYAPVAFHEELAGQAQFTDITVELFRWDRRFADAEFERFARSTIQVQQAIETHGQEPVMAALGELVGRFSHEDETLIAPYVAEVTSAVRRDGEAETWNDGA